MLFRIAMVLAVLGHVLAVALAVGFTWDTTVASDQAMRVMACVSVAVLVTWLYGVALRLIGAIISEWNEP